MFPLLAIASIGYITAFIEAPPVDIDGIREPLSFHFFMGIILLQELLFLAQMQ